MAKSKTRPVCSLASHSYWRRKDSIQWRTHWGSAPLSLSHLIYADKNIWQKLSIRVRHKTWLRECFWRPQCVNAAGCGGNRFFLFSISHSPVGKRSFTTYQPPPEHVGKDGLSREQTFPISGCREDFFWIGAQSLLFRVKKKKKKKKRMASTVLLRFNHWRMSPCQQMLLCDVVSLVFGSWLYKHGTV